MTILVGYPINRRAKAVLSMAGVLARSSGEELVVCTIIPAPWMPGLSRADQGYRSYIDDSANAALAEARADLPPDVPAKFTTVDARSAPSGLVEAAQKHAASIIAVGSSDAGQFGYITLSSVADRLLHSSPIPVAVAPRGFRAQGGKFARVTVAYTGSEQSDVLLGDAAGLGPRVRCTHASGIVRRPARTARNGSVPHRVRGCGCRVDSEHPGGRAPSA